MPQRSVLGPTMLLIYTICIFHNIFYYMILVVNDANLLKRIIKKEDCKLLQEDRDKIYQLNKKIGNRIQSNKVPQNEIWKSK